MVELWPAIGQSCLPIQSDQELLIIVITVPCCTCFAFLGCHASDALLSISIMPKSGIGKRHAEMFLLMAASAGTRLDVLKVTLLKKEYQKQPCLTCCRCNHTEALSAIL